MIFSATKHRYTQAATRAKGAVAPLVAVVLVLVIASAAFAVDLGMQRVLRRDLQALADVAALDLSRKIPGKTVAQLDALAPAVIADTLSRNKTTLGDDPDTETDDPQLTFTFGRIAPGPDGETVFTPGASGSKPTAVRVTATNSVEFAFAPGSGGASRSAIAVTEGGACYRLGSYAAAFNAGSSPILGPLLSALGTNIALTAADYRALADAEVRLADLLNAQVGAGTLGSVLDGNNLVKVSDFYSASAQAFEAGGGDAATVQLLKNLAVATGPINAQIPASDLINVTTEGAAGIEATLNVLDLLTASAAGATGQQGLAINQLAVPLGPIANVNSNVRVIQPPQVACGRANEIQAHAETSALTLNVSSTAADTNVAGLLRTNVSMTGSVQVAPAESELRAIRCEPEKLTVEADGGLTNVDLTLQVTVYANVLGVQVPVVSGPIRITGTSVVDGTTDVNVPTEESYDTPTTVPNSNSGIPTLSVNTTGLQLVGTPAGVSLNAVTASLTTGLINPLITSLDSQLLTPTFTRFGLDVTGVDVFATPKPRCDNAILRG